MKSSFIVLFLLFLPGIIFSQAVIKGKVVNAANGEPVAGSSVFINSTSIGTISDKTGSFELLNVPQGHHELVISSIGFETNVFAFSSDQLPLQLKIEMTIKIKELENVIVEPSVEETWEKWGKLFTENFIGATPNGSNSRIKNYKAIHFRFFKKSNRLIAYSDDPLIIENKALGYNIRYQLEQFEVSFKQGSTTFAGYPFFEDMDKNRKEARRRWQKAREKAFYGSMMHFMRCLYSNTLFQNGYEVRRMVRVPNFEKERVKKIYNTLRVTRTTNNAGNITISAERPVTDSMEYYERILRQKDQMDTYGKDLVTADSVSKSEGAYRILYFTDYLYVTYKNEVEDKAYLLFHNESRSPAFQRSYIWLPELQAITIDVNGNYYPPQGLFSMAYWAWNEKIGDMLPVDYRADE